MLIKISGDMGRRIRQRQILSHPKTMIWFDRNSDLPVVILDECLYSPELQQRVSKMGYNVLFLGSGLSDESIRAYMSSSQNTVLITADQEMDEWFHWKKCHLIYPQTMPIHKMVVEIDQFMWIHKEDEKK